MGESTFGRTPTTAKTLLVVALKREIAYHLVHVPDERGRVTPEIDSMREDFPALWLPMTAIMGRSISLWTLACE